MKQGFIYDRLVAIRKSESFFYLFNPPSGLRYFLLSRYFTSQTQGKKTCLRDCNSPTRSSKDEFISCIQIVRERDCNLVNLAEKITVHSRYPTVNNQRSGDDLEAQAKQGKSACKRYCCTGTNENLLRLGFWCYVREKTQLCVSLK